MTLFRRPNIAKMKKKQNINGLIEALNHKKVSVRRSAAEALGHLPDGRVVIPLISVLQDQDILVRRAAATSLVRLYKSGQLGKKTKRRIRDQHSVITHTDIPAKVSQTHYDQNDEKINHQGIFIGRDHTDNPPGKKSPHYDVGLNVDFDL